jgi:hypothetical protein
MKLDCVLTAVNENPLYLCFIPLFINSWKKLYPSVDVKIIVIANEIPEKYKEYSKHIVLFTPIENISTAFISQYIRILYPAILKYNNGVLITDMDMIPMNRTYYTKNIEEYDNSKFIYYRENVCFNYKQIAMCYNVAIPSIWKEIFNVNSIDDIINRLKTVNKSINYVDGHGKSGWCTDQIDLYTYVMNWNKKTNNLICLKENKTMFKRLDRNSSCNINNEVLRTNISNGIYTDYHCMRPFEKYKEINNKVLELL